MKRMITCLIRTCGRPLFPEYVRTLTRRVPFWKKAPSDIHVLVHGDRAKMTKKEMRLLEGSGYRIRWWNEMTDGSFPAIIYRMFRKYMGKGYDFIMPMDDDAEWGRPDLDLPYFIKDMDKNPKLGETGPVVVRCMWRRKTKGKDLKQYLATETEPSVPGPMGSPTWTADGSQIHRVKALESIDLTFLKKLHFRTDIHLTMSLIEAGWDTQLRIVPRYGHVSGWGQVEERTPQQTIEFWQKHIHDYLLSVKRFKKIPRFVVSLAQTIGWDSDRYCRIGSGKLVLDKYGSDQHTLTGGRFE